MVYSLFLAILKKIHIIKENPINLVRIKYT